MDFHRCRYCGETSFRASNDMVRYSTRHWAHKTCYIKRRGIAGLDAHQIESLPYFVLKQYGHLDDATKIVRELAEATKAFRAVQ